MICFEWKEWVNEMRRYDALSSTPKYLLSSVILLYKLKVFHESSIRQGFLQMEKIFTFVLLIFCGLAQGVQQCLYCTSGKSKQRLLFLDWAKIEKKIFFSFQILTEISTIITVPWGIDDLSLRLSYNSWIHLQSIDMS